MTNGTDILAPASDTATQSGAAAATEAVEPVVTMELVEDESIRPFRFHASDKALADLKRRIDATIFPERETVADGSQGV